LNTLTLLSVLVAAAATGDGAVATVNGVSISSSDVSARLSGREARGERMTAGQVVRELLDETLLAIEADRLKLPLPPMLQGQLDDSRLRIATRRQLDAAMDGITPDEATLREVFHLGADSVRLRLLVLASRGAAEQARDRLKSGASFAAESKSSLNPETVRLGGDLGLRSRAQLDGAVAKAAFEAPLDQVVGPVQLGLGWAVVQVSARAVGTEAEFQEKRERLREFAKQQMRASARRHYLDQLRAREKVSIDETFILSTGPSVDRAQAGRVVASVGKRQVRYGELLDFIDGAFRGRPQGHAFGAPVKVEMAGALIDDLVLRADAVRAGADRSPAVESELAPVRREAMAAALTLSVRESVPAPSESEAAEYLLRHAAEYRILASRRCRAVVVSDAAAATVVRKRLEAGETFASVAGAASIDQASAAQGGDLGDVSWASLDAMEKAPAQASLARAVKTAPAGALVGPVTAGPVQYVFRCEAVRPERVPELVEIRADVASRMRAEAGQRALDQLLVGLRASARISVDEEAVQRASHSQSHR
jgi:parvulin-like peptidyl-prolyl isomerase